MSVLQNVEVSGRLLRPDHDIVFAGLQSVDDGLRDTESPVAVPWPILLTKMERNRVRVLVTGFDGVEVIAKRLPRHCTLERCGQGDNRERMMGPVVDNLSLTGDGCLLNVPLGGDLSSVERRPFRRKSLNFKR